MRKAKALLLTGLLAWQLTGCVTTGGKPEVDREKAAESYVNLGIAYLREGDTENAREKLERALKYDSDSVRALSVLALTYHQDGEVELAEKYFRKALWEDRSDPETNNNYAAFLYDIGRYDEAAEYFKKAADNTDYSERSRSFENLGLTLLKLKDTEAAEASFRRALRLNKGLPRAHLELSNLLFKQSNFSEAQKHYEAFTQLASQDARSLLIGIQIAKAFNDNDRMASYGLQLRKMYPGSSELKQYQGMMANEKP
ncbi:type IV pilus biogenesis/stability protein PilW [Zooshikella ganghwensis]|uniref:Type IV pilus biogenesis/stability protein PilW n=1 Tax=Zooshikella ganghwensis TaxID=202772 RepID=A0A4P9VKQ7_9GAMM|nr:type IV pilus biogenesis/stability protein PilW [Zooshikella ganghwensis]RDH42974.1 type IV pilus biogenesis/stability protein PilW [Zooshikella ganghwensis]